jgi:hypothetical protein
MGETRDVSEFGMEPLSKFDIRERHILVSYVNQKEGFRLLQRVMEDTLKLLNQKMIKTDNAEEKAVLAAHAKLNGANDFYHMLLQMLQEEAILDEQAISDIGTPDNPERPVYPAEFDGQEGF